MAAFNSFLQRTDPTKSAADLGCAYLPQQLVSKRMFEDTPAGCSRSICRRMTVRS